MKFKQSNFPVRQRSSNSDPPFSAVRLYAVAKIWAERKGPKIKIKKKRKFYTRALRGTERFLSYLAHSPPGKGKNK